MQTLLLDQKRVMIYFSGTDDLDQLIQRDPKPKVKIEEIIPNFDYAVKLPEIGVKQLRL